MGAGLSETARQPPGSGPSWLAQQVRALVQALPARVLALPPPVSLLLLAFSEQLF